jgi:hypothetical protein
MDEASRFRRTVQPVLAIAALLLCTLLVSQVTEPPRGTASVSAGSIVVAALDATTVEGGWRPKNLGACIAMLALWVTVTSMAPYGAIMGAALVPLVVDACA